MLRPFIINYEEKIFVLIYKIYIANISLLIYN